MLRLALVLLAAVIGFVVFAVSGYVLIAQFSANVHDRSVEAASRAKTTSWPGL